MTLSAVGSVFSSSDTETHPLKGAGPAVGGTTVGSSAHQTPPKRNSKNGLWTPHQQLASPSSPVLSPAASSVGGHDNSSLTDLSFTPPHSYTQLSHLSALAGKRNQLQIHDPLSQQELDESRDLPLRCHGVSLKLHHLATSLEQWTNVILNPEPLVPSSVDETLAFQRVKEHLIPDMVSRLRYLSGVLDGTIDSNDYDEIFGGDSLGCSEILSPRQGRLEDLGNDDSIISATSTLTPSRPTAANSSRLISRAYDSDDSSVMPPSPAPGPSSVSISPAPATIRSQEVTLNDWVGSGRENPSSDPSVEELLEMGGENISPIQILYSKPSRVTAPSRHPPPPSRSHPPLTASTESPPPAPL